MPDETNDETPGVEPQSYGSTEEWLEGDTAQTVQNTPGKTDRHDEAFYRSDHDADAASASEAPAATRMAASREGRDTSAVEIVTQSGKKVPESNETRQSYFRRRDYD